MRLLIVLVIVVVFFSACSSRAVSGEQSSSFEQSEHVQWNEMEPIGSEFVRWPIASVSERLLRNKLGGQSFVVLDKMERDDLFPTSTTSFVIAVGAIGTVNGVGMMMVRKFNDIIAIRIGALGSPTLAPTIVLIGVNSLPSRIYVQREVAR